MKNFIFILIFLFMTSCSQKVYIEKKVPIKCDVELPAKPRLVGDFLIDLANALKHSEILERDLIVCIGKGE